MDLQSALVDCSGSSTETEGNRVDKWWFYFYLGWNLMAKIPSWFVVTLENLQNQIDDLSNALSSNSQNLQTKIDDFNITLTSATEGR